jgi:hypothetical protein
VAISFLCVIVGNHGVWMQSSYDGCRVVDGILMSAFYIVFFVMFLHK